jgi:hypothetical protein
MQMKYLTKVGSLRTLTVVLRLALALKVITILTLMRYSMPILPSLVSQKLFPSQNMWARGSGGKYCETAMTVIH